MACRRQTLGGRSARPLIHSSYTITWDTTGAYQKLRDLMMGNPPDITVDSIYAMANQLGLDWPGYNAT